MELTSSSAAVAVRVREEWGPDATLFGCLDEGHCAQNANTVALTNLISTSRHGNRV